MVAFKLVSAVQQQGSSICPPFPFPLLILLLAFFPSSMITVQESFQSVPLPPSLSPLCSSVIKSLFRVRPPSKIQPRESPSKVIIAGSRKGDRDRERRKGGQLRHHAIRGKKIVFLTGFSEHNISGRENRPPPVLFQSVYWISIDWQQQQQNAATVVVVEGR